MTRFIRSLLALLLYHPTRISPSSSVNSSLAGPLASSSTLLLGSSTLLGVSGHSQFLGGGPLYRGPKLSLQGVAKGPVKACMSSHRFPSVRRRGHGFVIGKSARCSYAPCLYACSDEPHKTHLFPPTCRFPDWPPPELATLVFIFFVTNALTASCARCT